MASVKATRLMSGNGATSGAVAGPSADVPTIPKKTVTKGGSSTEAVARSSPLLSGGRSSRPGEGRHILQRAIDKKGNARAKSVRIPRLSSGVGPPRMAPKPPMSRTSTSVSSLEPNPPSFCNVPSFSTKNGRPFLIPRPGHVTPVSSTPPSSLNGRQLPTQSPLKRSPNTSGAPLVPTVKAAARKPLLSQSRGSVAPHRPPIAPLGKVGLPAHRLGMPMSPMRPPYQPPPMSVRARCPLPPFMPKSVPGAPAPPSQPSSKTKCPSAALAAKSKSAAYSRIGGVPQPKMAPRFGLPGPMRGPFMPLGAVKPRSMGVGHPPPGPSQYGASANDDPYGLDEYDEEDLDFIDDGPLEGAQKTSQQQGQSGSNWKSVLRGITGYNPALYVDRDEGEANESSLWQQEEEERRSSRIAAVEDAIELKRIQEEAARERARLSAKSTG